MLRRGSGQYEFAVLGKTENGNPVDKDQKGEQQITVVLIVGIVGNLRGRRIGRHLRKLKDFPHLPNGDGY